MSMSTNLQRYLAPKEEVYTSVADRMAYAAGLQQGSWADPEWAPDGRLGWYTTEAWRPVWRGTYFSRRWRLGNARPFWVGYTEANQGEPPLVVKEDRLISLAAIAIAAMPAEDRPEIRIVWDQWDYPEIETYLEGRLVGITTGNPEIPEYGCFTYLGPFEDN